MSADKRLTRVTVRLTHVEKSRWQETVRREGLDLSSFLRRMMSIRNGAGPRRIPLAVTTIHPRRGGRREQPGARTEGFNGKAKLVIRRAYGYKSFRNYRLRLLSACA